MGSGLIIFILALSARLLNLLFQDLNINTYIIEDQKIYWEWSLKNAYTLGSTLSDNLLTERMPGSFLFFQFLQWLTNKSLFFILFIQSVVDAFSCVIIANCAYLIKDKYKLYVGLFAAFSPLLIITSSQVLSDTLFLFCFVISLYYLLKFFKFNNNSYILISGLMLGFSTFIRAATFPFIFLSLPIVFYIIKNNVGKNSKSIILLGFYLVFCLIPISDRLYKNFVNYNTIALTSQVGSHAAYWMVPGVLSIDDKYDREKAIQYVNLQIEKKGGLTGEPFVDSNKMLDIAKDILSNQSLFKVSYAWLRASVLNTIISPIILDNRVRNLSHPSFAKTGSINVWFKNIILNKKYIAYFSLLIISAVLSIFSLILILWGFFILIKSNLKLFFLSIIIIIYFCLITGPTLSPKYCMPYVPIIFYLQAIVLERLFSFYKSRIKGQYY